MEKLRDEIVLENDAVRLEPMRASHRDALVQAASDGELWNLSVTTVPKPDAMAEYIASAVNARSKKSQYPFVVFRKSTDTIVGSTRYYEIATHDRRVAVGWTWYAESAQRTEVNTACKFLLLQHAFEVLDCFAVAFHTHSENVASRRAILRLGAMEEGVLRNHRVMADGHIRDTVCFSILDSEWPTVKPALVEKMTRA